MSTAQTDRPATTQPTGRTADQPTTPSADRPTATFPTGQWLADQAAIEQAHRERRRQAAPRPFEGWRDRAPAGLLPAVTGPTAFPRVSTLPEPTGGREALDRARGPRRSRTKGPHRRERLARAERRREARRRHLRRALAGVLIAVALLTGLSLCAAQGISQARQAALAQRDREGYASSVTSAPPVTPVTHDAPSVTPVTPVTPASPVNTVQDNSSVTQKARTGIRPEWVTENTGAAYDRTNPYASPLSLPRCTTSPDTPLPCLATISPSQRRAVVLEEDASLTALVRQ